MRWLMQMPCVLGGLDWRTEMTRLCLIQWPYIGLYLGGKQYGVWIAIDPQENETRADIVEDIRTTGDAQ
jgi:hypothetical protein